MATEKRKGSINEVWNENLTLKKIRTRKTCEGCKTQYSRSYFFSLHKPNTFKTINGHVELKIQYCQLTLQQMMMKFLMTILSHLICSMIMSRMSAVIVATSRN